MSAILKLIRIPNLLIIILTQVMLRYYIISPIMKNQGVEPLLGGLNFSILVLIFVLMAAAGYIINDYFDMEADRINRPSRLIVGTKISTMQAKIIYAVLNVIAIGLGFYLAFQVKFLQLGLIFPVMIIMLWYYSAKYKRMVFWGNLVVAVLLGFTVFAVWLFEFFALRLHSFDFISAYHAIQWIQYFVWGFTFFAFLTTLIREMIKDIEDMEGDRRTGCQTLPVTIGVTSCRWIIGGLILLSMLTLGYAQYWLFQNGLIWAFWYFVITVQVIFVFALIKLSVSREKKDFGFLGSLIKVAMLAGIISMQLIYFNL